jgi:hypothetical protein
MKSSQYFDDRYDKAAEHRRGIILLWIFAALFFGVLFLWVWYHLPGMFKGSWTWSFPALALDAKTKMITAGTLGPAIIDWLLAALAGALLYALTNIAGHLPKVQRRSAQFRAFTGWYFVNLLSGGVIAVIVLLLLTNLSVTLGEGAVTLDFAKMPGAMLTGAAFILGFYGHVAKAQLDEIASTLFRRAWLVAEGRFHIAPADVKVIFGKQQQFRISPPADVTWSAERGTIDGTGLYTAPQRSDAVTPGSRVQIRAALQADSTITDVAAVTLVPFILLADHLQMTAGESQQLRVDSPPSEGVALEAKYGATDGLKYTAPSADDLKAKGISEDIVTARRKPKAVAGDDAAKKKEEETAKLDFDSITIKLEPEGKG